MGDEARINFLLDVLEGDDGFRPGAGFHAEQAGLSVGLEAGDGQRVVEIGALERGVAVEVIA